MDPRLAGIKSDYQFLISNCIYFATILFETVFVVLLGDVSARLVVIIEQEAYCFFTCSFLIES